MPPTKTPARPAPADTGPAPSGLVLPSVPALVLQLSIAVAGAAATVGLVTVAGAPDSRQTIAYVVCFFIVPPAAIACGPRLERSLSGLPAPTAAILSAIAAAGVLATVLAARVVNAVGGSAAPVLIGGVVVWCLGGIVAGSILQSDRRSASRLLAVHPRVVTAARGATATLVVLSMVGFVPDRLRGPGTLAICLIVGAAIMALVLAAERLPMPRLLGVGADTIVAGLILLAAINASSYLPHLPYNPISAQAMPFGADLNLALLTHQSFYLGPVSDVLQGNVMLVDTFGQYGVGVIYFLALVFTVVPLGYGPLGLVSGALTGLALAGAYAILRSAGCSRAIAGIAMVVGVVVTQLESLPGYLGSDFPSAGALRFGPAYLLILVLVARARWPAHGRSLRVAGLAVVAISAVWSIEALAYALAITLAVEAVEAATFPGSWRTRARRWIIGAGRVLAASAGALVVLEVLTRLVSGQWPDWGPYVAFLTLYSGRTVPNVFTFPAIGAWSSGFAVGFVYLASAAATARLAFAAHPSPELRARLVAAAALSAFGALSLSYWITHGAPIALRSVALPAVLLGGLWVDLAVGRRWLWPRIRVGALAFGSLVTALVAVFAWPQANQTADRTALIHALPGPPSFRGDIGSLWHSPRLDPRSLEAEGVLHRHVPRDWAVAMLVQRDLGLEILMRTGRANAIPFGYALQSDVISPYVLPRVRRAVDRLAPGTLALFDVHDINGSPLARESLRAALLDQARALVQRRFTLRVIETTPNGLTLVRLERRAITPGRPSP